jgi:hypothetical protein
MRRLVLLAAGLVAGLIVPTLAATTAEAQSRRQPLRVQVEGRNFLDAGKLVPVGHLNRHHFTANSMPMTHTGSVSNLGRDNLPDRFAGPNPFANSFTGPSLR